MATQKIAEKLDKLIEVTARLDERQVSMGKTIDHINSKFDGLAARVMVLESWKSKVIGYGAAVATGVSIAVHFAVKVIAGKQ